MSREITISAHWDDEAEVWLATSADVPGLAVEAETWTRMIAEVRDVLPELLVLGGSTANDRSLTFRAEEHFDLAGA